MLVFLCSNFPALYLFATSLTPGGSDGASVVPVVGFYMCSAGSRMGFSTSGCSPSGSAWGLAMICRLLAALPNFLQLP